MVENTGMMISRQSQVKDCIKEDTKTTTPKQRHIRDCVEEDIKITILQKKMYI